MAVEATVEKVDGGWRASARLTVSGRTYGTSKVYQSEAEALDALAQMSANVGEAANIDSSAQTL